MKSGTENEARLTEEDKDKLIELLANNLPVLRAKIGVSQEEVSNIIGVSRQTYSSIETKKRKMAWSMFLSLVLFFGCNDGTATMLDGMGILTPQLNDFLNRNNRKEFM